MATPFKLKSGNASAFKNLGSSPAKSGVKVSLGMGSEANANLEKKINTSKLPKNFNATGNKASTTPKYNMKNKGNFNFTGDSKSTTPKYSTTKAAKLTKTSTKGISGVESTKTPSSKTIGGKGTRNLTKQAVKNLARVGKFVRGATLVGAATELFKGYKNVNPKISKPLTSGKI